MRHNSVLATAVIGAVALSGLGLESCGEGTVSPPNIIFILADDLGYGELGSYGQTKIRTPNIDRLAAEGMRFSQHYSGSPVCAPSRAVLLTGLHTGHAYIRDNDEMSERGDVWRDLSLEGQRPLPANTFTIGTMLQNAGYTTGAIGKWGLGGPGSSGEPNRQGFDHWYGYLCQRIAHGYYPPYLWRNTEKHVLENEYVHPHQRLPEDADPFDPASYEPYSGTQYSMDLMSQEALDFIRRNREEPFFLYLPFPVPHVALQVPEESVAEYEGAFPETPYVGDRGYLPHRTPHAAYAAMITRMDREIGRIRTLLEELGLDDNTLIIFTSDNGPTFNGGTDSEFFNSAGPLRGLKTQLYEGGIRVPLIAWWPELIEAGSTSDHVSAFWDFLPTFAELVGTEIPTEVDGLSLLPTLFGRSDEQARHEYLYWEYQGRQAVRLGDWKGYRGSVDGAIELYDLAADIGETRDVADLHPDVVARIAEIMRSGRTESELFPLVRSR
ncbi:MAG: sulfatase-like hydrolase/transferase [Gemmatimonadetes bacterium]|nr:sulfatase-like hydrolase/transferase [Gemmatimonadota bacterium]NIO32229.1 sulfatase-like hydrolase/transferase [Gemmatimonadota bacterium]